MLENNISTNQLKNILDAHGVKPSFQRLSVLKYIVEHRDHPSVDNIFNNLRDQIPTLSKTTVYNTLNLLTQKCIITALTINDVEVKYDYIEIPHAHFLCTNCGRIFDIELDTDIYNTEFIDNHKVIDTQINFKGICNNCKQ